MTRCATFAAWTAGCATFAGPAAARAEALGAVAARTLTAGTCAGAGGRASAARAVTVPRPAAGLAELRRAVTVTASEALVLERAAPGSVTLVAAPRALGPPGGVASRCALTEGAVAGRAS